MQNIYLHSWLGDCEFISWQWPGSLSSWVSWMSQAEISSISSSNTEKKNNQLKYCYYYSIDARSMQWSSKLCRLVNARINNKLQWLLDYCFITLVSIAVTLRYHGHKKAYKTHGQAQFSVAIFMNDILFSRRERSPYIYDRTGSIMDGLFRCDRNPSMW